MTADLIPSSFYLMEMRLQGSHQLPVDMWKMIDELPQALKYTLSTTHNLYILSLPEQKTGQHALWKEEKKKKEREEEKKKEKKEKAVWVPVCSTSW